MKNIWIERFFILFLCALTPAIYFGCAANDASFDPKEGPDISSLENGRQLLIAHRINDAHLFYKAEYQKSPGSGNAAVGFAITNLLLMPYDPAVTALIHRMGGTGALNKKRDVIYADNGVISLFTQGTPIEDQGGFSGIRSLLGPDLPWNAEQLDDPNFLNKIDVQLHDVADDVVEISDNLLPIITALEVGINDPYFGGFELPGEVFFNDNLTLSINRADLAFVVAALRAERATSFFVAAYEHPFKISDLGSQWDNIATDDPLYKEDYQANDYILTFLDPKIFRTIRDPSRLSAAGKELQLALQSIQKALQVAIEEPRFGALAWNTADQDAITKASTFIEALEKSVDESTKLPFIEPSLSLDMSVVFKDGRTLDPLIPWFTFRPDDFDPSFIITDLNKDTFEPLFEGLFTPPLADLENSEFSEAQNFEDLASQLFGRLNDDFNTSFGN